MAVQSGEPGGHALKRDAEAIVNAVLEAMVESLRSGSSIEIRGFGSFRLRHRAARVGRNPKTGEAVALAAKYVPHFKPGKELRERVNQKFEEEQRKQRENAG